MWYGKSGSKLCCLIHLCYFTHGRGELRANKTDRNRPPFLFLYPAALPDGDLACYTADGAPGGWQWQVVGSVVYPNSVFSGSGIKGTVLVSSFPQIWACGVLTLLHGDSWQYRALIFPLKVFDLKDPHGSYFGIHWTTPSLKPVLFLSNPFPLAKDLSLIVSKWLL